MNYNNLNYAAFAARTLLIIIIFSFFNTSNADCKDIATFLRVMGQVLHLKENKPPGTPAKIQEGAAEGDGVHTKVASRAQLRLIDISDLFIAPKSEIVLDYYSINPKGKETIATLVTKGLVHVFGNLLLKHDPPQFFIKTTSAMGSIRGTDFYVLIGKNYTDFFVKTGQLYVFAIENRRTSNKLPELLEKQIEVRAGGGGLLLRVLDT